MSRSSNVRLVSKSLYLEIEGMGAKPPLKKWGWGQSPTV